MLLADRKLRSQQFLQQNMSLTVSSSAEHFAPLCGGKFEACGALSTNFRPSVVLELF